MKLNSRQLNELEVFLQNYKTASRLTQYDLLATDAKGSAEWVLQAASFVPCNIDLASEVCCLPIG